MKAATRPLKICMLYGRHFSGGPGSFDVASLYETKGLTGSESFFFRTAHGLAERGHSVQVFADITEEMDVAPTLAGAACYRLESSSKLDLGVDVVIAYNEPDLLRLVPTTALRICLQQVNDFDYAQPGYDEFVDLYLFPSETHRQFMISSCRLNEAKTAVMPNSIDLEHFEGTEERRHRSVAHVSSPDRGLHWLLEYWPLVRKQVPDATLRVYYKFDSWLQGTRDLWYDHGLKCYYETGFRARYVAECLKRLGRNGENGLYLVGPIPNKPLARELMKTEVLSYPCCTLRWSEGFSVSIMDACAAGAVPIISDVDAIGEVYRDAATIIPGRPQSRDPRWVDAIVKALTDDDWRAAARERCMGFVHRHSRQVRAQQWETLLTSELARRAEKAA